MCFFLKNEVNKLKILIDADGCPVTRIAVDEAEKHGIEAIIYCDTSHDFSSYNAKVITVSKGADSADFALVNDAEKGDIVITQDYGLAAMALAKKAIPLTQNGLVINDFNIDGLLNSRHEAKAARRAGKHLKGPSKRTHKQDADFTAALLSLIK